MEAIKNFDEMVSHLAGRDKKRRVAVICPNDSSTREAVLRACTFIDPIFVGSDSEAQAALKDYPLIEATDVDDAAAKAVALVHEGRADVIMKGLLNTDNLLRAVLNKETGILEKGRVLTHLTCAQIPQMDRLLFCTDVAVIPYPTAEQRQAQLQYLLDLCRAMGVAEPRVALINCSEKVDAKHFPFTEEYRQLITQTEEGHYGPCIVDGPLDLKTAISPEALHKKGLHSTIDGRADGLIFPDIQAGNVFYKAITFFAHARTAAILKGPQVPVVLTSRADNAESKFFSLALACM
ncbi:MAG: phosphate butyryltransferase [Prevotella sp.]|nr:phosphate butyryltransferase [Prevotella sp.]